MSSPDRTDPSGRERSLVAYVREQLRAARGTRSGPRANWREAVVGSLRDLLAESLPGYEIMRKVSDGGQGVVYEAIQRSTGQRVALKVLRAGPLADDATRARFEREVEILVRLNHPNIVRVIDSGLVAGCSYYVMDFISGHELDRYVSANDLPIRDTLLLFARVCDAVNAAHLNGVIHRDLKPNNILVDAAGDPHLLDFGFAKIESQDQRAQAPQLSLSGQFFGALNWASPEQIERGSHAVDTRSDVYSLGVILFQLLTRRFPYDVSGTYEQVMRAIRSVEPAHPGEIRRELAGDAERIILKCLSKEPSHRYETAGALAQDIRRYLAGEPIEAGPDSSWYVIKTKLAQHRVAASVITRLRGLGQPRSNCCWRVVVRVPACKPAVRLSAVAGCGAAQEDGRGGAASDVAVVPTTY